MSVLADILDQIDGLLQGTSGVERMIEEDKFKRVADERDLSAGLAARDPRPYWLEPESFHGLLDESSDVAGDFLHLHATIRVDILYADQPHDRQSLFKQIADDALQVAACLYSPRNWGQVAGWTGVELELGLEAVEDDRGVPRLWSLTISMMVSYRENLG